MPVHRAGKRNIDCRSSTDNNIFNLQSLVNLRARGSGQPNQHVNQRNQNKGSMARSASFVNYQQIMKSKRFPLEIPHFKSTVFNHQLEQEPRNTGRFLTTYQLTARSLSPFSRKDSKFQNSLRQRDHQANQQRKKGLITKRGNQNMKNWTTLTLTQQDGIAMMYQKLKSQKIRKQQMKRAQSQMQINKKQDTDRFQAGTDKTTHIFRPLNLQQAKAYNQFLSKSSAVSPKTKLEPNPFHIDQNKDMLLTLPSPQTYQQQQNLNDYSSPTKSRKLQRQASPISNFNIRDNLSPTRIAKSVINDRTKELQSMRGSQYNQGIEQNLNVRGKFRNTSNQKVPHSDFVGGNSFNSIPHHTGRLINDFGDNNDVKSEFDFRREVYTKPDWKIQKEIKQKEKEIDQEINNSVNFNPNSIKVQEEKFYQSLLKEEQKLRQKLQKIQLSNQQISRTRVLNHHSQVPEEQVSQQMNMLRDLTSKTITLLRE